MSRTRARLSYANVMATIAVFVALGGSSYAAIVVTGKQVKDRSLTGRDVKPNSLTSRHVKELTAGDFAAGQLPAAGAPGERGPQGEPGPQGPQGPEGAPNPNAADSQRLDGLDSTDFLRSNAKAADAETVDGVDAAVLARTNAVRAFTRTVPSDSYSGFYLVNTEFGQPPGVRPDPFGELWYDCPQNLASNGTLRYRNWAGGTASLFSDNGLGDPNAYQVLGNSGTFDQSASSGAAGEHITLQVAASGRVVTWDVFSVHRPATSDCYVQAVVSSGQHYTG